MTRIRTLTALAAASLSLAAAPTAFASTTTVGSTSGTPTTNICSASFACTYLNVKSGAPTDVIKHSGKITAWSVNAGSTGGQVELRVLQPTGSGKYKAITTSSTHTVSHGGINTFSAGITVKSGEVIALENATSGIYMAAAPTGHCVSYFDYSDPLQNGMTGKPDQSSHQLHTLLSAKLAY